jgi:hypothetical protein
VTGDIAGGLVGVVGYEDTDKATVITNSYYNGDTEQAVGGYFHRNGGGIDNNPDGAGIVTEVQKVTDEEFAYIDPLIDGTMDLNAVKTDIVTKKEQARQEQIRQEQARQDLITTVASLADDQQASIAQLAATAGQALDAPELTPVDLTHAIRDFTPSQTRGPDRSYSASVKEVTVDGVTYLVDDDEEKEN